jgi:hypothetical protein
MRTFNFFTTVRGGIKKAERLPVDSFQGETLRKANCFMKTLRWFKTDDFPTVHKHSEEEKCSIIHPIKINYSDANEPWTREREKLRIRN